MAEVLEPVLKVEKVNKRFGSFNALTDLTFSVEAGHVFGMVGENGSGKSTALRIVVGLEKADSGSISICGLDASEHPTEIYHYIGYVPDSFGLYENLLVQEYMTFFAEASGLEGYLARRRISHALEMVGLSGREGLYVDYLSSSMKQRLCIARAMLNYPRLLILDDPMKGIDLKNRFELRDVIRELSAQGTTILISSHMITELTEFCTDLGIMAGGTMKEQGSMEHFLKQSRLNRPLKIRVSGMADQAVAVLDRLEPVHAVTVDRNQLRVIADNTTEAETKILSELVREGIPVVSFLREDENFEAFIKRKTGGDV